MTRLVPIRPFPRQDQTLSSWLSLVAYLHDMTLRQLIELDSGFLLQFVMPDIDRAPKLAFLEYLASLTGYGIDQFQSMVLSKYEGIVFTEMPISGWGQFLLPIARNTKERRKTGQPFCPHCLNTDATPYFRIHWRLAFYTICIEHQSVLVDHCGHCETPVRIPTYVEKTDENHRKLILVCEHCGRNLALSTTATQYDKSELGFDLLVGLLNEFHSGVIKSFSGNLHQYSFLFFDGWRQILSLLVRPSSGRKLLFAMETEGIKINRELCSQFKPQFEGLSCAVRNEVVRLSLILLSDWPTVFVKVCLTARLTESRLMIDKMDLPYWFSRTVRDNLCRFRYRVNKEEMLNARHHLEQRNIRVSVKKIRATMGITVGKFVHEFVTPSRSLFTHEETLHFFETFDSVIKHASLARGHRAALARDRTIILLFVLGFGTLQEICSWTHANVESAIAVSKAATFDSLSVPKLLDSNQVASGFLHLVWYLGFVIDDWDKINVDDPRWVFPSRQNMPIHIESVRIRAGVIKKLAGLESVVTCIEALRF